MSLPFRVLLLVLLTGCQAPAPGSADKEGAVATRASFDASGLTFTHPQTGHVFKLHLGDELCHDTGGVTPVPAHIRGGIRDATSSYYEPVDMDGGTYAAAESLYSRDHGDLVAGMTRVQYQPDSGRLLITEDKSDALPRRRYILYSLLSGGGYDMVYLCPPWDWDFAGPGIKGPPDIELLRGDRAKIEGKIMKVDQIEHSPHPFTVGN